MAGGEGGGQPQAEYCSLQTLSSGRAEATASRSGPSGQECGFLSGRSRVFLQRRSLGCGDPHQHPVGRRSLSWSILGQFCSKWLIGM